VEYLIHGIPYTWVKPYTWYTLYMAYVIHCKPYSWYTLYMVIPEILVLWIVKMLVILSVLLIITEIFIIDGSVNDPLLAINACVSILLI